MFARPNQGTFVCLFTEPGAAPVEDLESLQQEPPKGRGDPGQHLPSSFIHVSRPRVPADMDDVAATTQLPGEALGNVVHLDDVLSGCSTAQQVIDAAVGPGLVAFEAKGAVIGLAGYRLRVEPVAATPGLERLTDPFAGRSLDTPHPITEAIRTGRPLSLHPLPEEILQGRPGAGLGAVRGRAMPILGTRGVIGGLCLFLGPEQQPYESALHAVLIERLAAAIERTRLLESERRLRVRSEQAAARLSRLQSLTSGLSAALGPVDVADAVMTHALAELGATGGTCFMLADDGTLRPVGSMAGDTESRRAISLKSGDPLGPVLRRGGVVILPSAPGAPDGGGQPAHRAIVPLVIRGEILGAIELTFDRDREVDVELRSFLSALGTQCAQAVERARLYGQRAKEAHVLQASLMPPALPSIPGLDIAAGYRPFGDGTGIGGDFYDLYALGSGRWGVVVGDVSGRGIEAAATTALARYTTRAAALLGTAPAEVLRILNRVMLSEALGERFCTIAHGVLRPSANGVDVTLSLGGHPRPLLLDRRTGSAYEVGTPGTAVGLVPDPVLRETNLTLRSGDVLVFFTDGCVDFHTEGGTTSDERVLLDVLRRYAGESVGELTKRLEEAVLVANGGRNSDDAALLVMRAHPDESRRSAGSVPFGAWTRKEKEKR
jgi:serine phosphatase RsbU (regulator of sigma subunit)